MAEVHLFHPQHAAWEFLILRAFHWQKKVTCADIEQGKSLNIDACVKSLLGR